MLYNLFKPLNLHQFYYASLFQLVFCFILHLQKYDWWSILFSLCFVDFRVPSRFIKTKRNLQQKKFGKQWPKGTLRNQRYLCFYNSCFILDRVSAYPYNSGTYILSYVYPVDTVNFYIIFWKECVELLMRIETVW
jgi:hypothetical protein